MSATILRPCPGCARHVKQGECVCPFCGAKVLCAKDPARASGGRKSRTALFAAGAVGAALGTTDCVAVSSEPPYGAGPPGVDASDNRDGRSTEPMDGASAVDGDEATTPDAASSVPDANPAPDAADAGDERPLPVPAYGAFIPRDAAGPTDGNSSS